MLIIRLLRTGKKNAPSYRIVLTEKTAPPQSGKFLEILGHYNPRLAAKDGGKGRKGKKEISLKEERIKYWLSQGVKTSETVHNLLVSQGIIKGPKIKKKIRIKKKSKKTEAPDESPAVEQSGRQTGDSAKSADEPAEKSAETAPSDETDKKEEQKEKEPAEAEERKDIQEEKQSKEAENKESNRTDQATEK
jgi:small subunit ribosomal protein S16